MEYLNIIAPISILTTNVSNEIRQKILIEWIKYLGEDLSRIKDTSSPNIYSVVLLEDLPYPAWEGDICYVSEVNLPGTYENGLWRFNVPANDYDTILKFRNLDMLLKEKEN